ncbi:MAG: hypothetical protein Q8K85_16760, partial [Hyphomicrobium sp.]|nr:hypothetical protein [Hyphomicrobium sp.]
KMFLACVAPPHSLPIALRSLAALICLSLAALWPNETAFAQQAPSAQPQAQQQSDPAFIAADAAYKALERHNNAAALLDAREAVRLAPQRRDYRLLLVNVLSANNRLREAEADLSALLAEKKEPDVFLQRAYLRLRRGNKSGAAADFSATAPAFDPASDKGRSARLGLFDAAIASGSPRQALNALAPYAKERSYAISSRRGFALLALKRYQEAQSAFALAAALASSAAEHSAMTRAQIGVLVDLGRKDEAKALFARSLSAGTLAGSANMDIAYLALRVGDDPTALDYFRLAKAHGELKGTAAFDAGYVAKRLAQNAEAIAFFKMGIDADAVSKTRRDPQYIFGVRREVAELERVGSSSSAKPGITNTRTTPARSGGLIRAATC